MLNQMVVSPACNVSARQYIKMTKYIIFIKHRTLIELSPFKTLTPKSRAEASSVPCIATFKHNAAFRNRSFVMHINMFDDCHH